MLHLSNATLSALKNATLSSWYSRISVFIRQNGSFQRLLGLRSEYKTVDLSTNCTILYFNSNQKSDLHTGGERKTTLYKQGKPAPIYESMPKENSSKFITLKSIYSLSTLFVHCQETPCNQGKVNRQYSHLFFLIKMNPSPANDGSSHNKGIQVGKEVDRKKK